MLEELKKQQSRRISQPMPGPRANPTFLPVSLEGGIGDAILSRLTIQLLMKNGLNPVVWSTHAQAVNYFGHGVQQGKIPDFAWHLSLDPMPQFKFFEDFSGFVYLKHQHLFEAHRAFLHEGELGQAVRIHSDQKWNLTNIAHEWGLSAETLPAFALGMATPDAIKPKKRTEVGSYITIHDGYDAQNEQLVSGRSTKQWDWRHWNRLVALLKDEYPDRKIIQLGTKMGRAIDGVDDLLLGKTTIPEAFDYLSKSWLHIDTDSGLAHAATKLGTPCVVLFGPTPKHFYGHPENMNLSSDASCAGNCFWLTKTWMDRCPIGHPTPKCMDDISPERVLAAIRL